MSTQEQNKAQDNNPWPEDTEVVLDIIRETGSKQWFNRYCQDPKTKEVFYYCETDDNEKVTIHRGGADGPVIANATQCLEKEGVTDVHFVQPKLTVCMEHVHSYLPLFHGKHTFEYNGKKYHWKGHTALIDDETGVLIAALHTRFLESNPNKIGTLVITLDGKPMMDIAVITCFVMQERSEEGRLAAELAQRRLNSSGRVMF